MQQLSTVDPVVFQVVRPETMDWYDPEFPIGDLYELPDELAARLDEADRLFWAAQTAVGAYLRAVRRDAESYKHPAEIERKRLERGRMRQYRRPNPARS